MVNKATFTAAVSTAAVASGVGGATVIGLDDGDGDETIVRVECNYQ